MAKNYFGELAKTVADQSDIDPRTEVLREYLLKLGDQESVKQFDEMLDLSWVYHDCALEGVVLTLQELRDALEFKPVTDATTSHAYEEVRRLKAAIDFVREGATRKKLPLDLDLFRRLYLFLEPDEQGAKSVKYRKDIPLHRMYFHEISLPEKISYRMRRLQEFIAQEEAEKTHPIKFAARVHFKFLAIFPFSQHSGRVARLVMNFILLRGGYPPAILHSSERQRYYEALRGPVQNLVELLREALLSTIEAHEKFYRINLDALARQAQQQKMLPRSQGIRRF